jgi:Family of unknown function (DUF6519)
MKGDFTRVTFDPTKHYSRVLMQQGRVTLDADSNEQSAILLHYLRTLARDLIGPFAGPAADAGFQLSDEDGALSISAGRYYVDGILVENNEDVLYSAQPHWTVPPDDPLLEQQKDQSGDAFWVYLDVWERHITYLQDDQIREVALNGPDTGTRAQVVWQVKSLPAPGVTISDDGKVTGSTCGQPMGELAPSSARLAARVDPGQPVEDACITPPDSKYRGRENQLYRVEIHDGSGAAQPTFKWSRENGSVVTAWLGTQGNDLRVAHGRGFTGGSWVELSDDVRELQGLPGVLVLLTKVEGDLLSVDPASVPASDALAWSPQLVHPIVRRWDQRANDTVQLSHGAVSVKEMTATDPMWLDLENGVQIQFSTGGTYRTGDYWLIPARVAGGKIEWPTTVNAAGKAIADALPPQGIEHHYAPLGFVSWKNQKLSQSSCQCLFSPSRACFNGGPDLQPMEQPLTIRRTTTRPSTTRKTGGKRTPTP